VREPRAQAPALPEPALGRQGRAPEPERQAQARDSAAEPQVEVPEQAPREAQHSAVEVEPALREAQHSALAPALQAAGSGRRRYARG
jgi:hypothetical protein